MSWSAGTFRHATRISRFESSFMLDIAYFVVFKSTLFFQKECFLLFLRK